MKNNIELGIEISEGVLNTNIPRKINRYYDIEKSAPKIVKVSKIVPKKSLTYRYRPGVNNFMIGDLDV